MYAIKIEITEEMLHQLLRPHIERILEGEAQDYQKIINVKV